MTITAFPAFKSDEGRARYLAAYDAALRDWPVACEELDLPTRHGATHVVACGAAELPALVLLPSFAGSATVWRLNAAELSRHYRVYAVDVIGQPGKSLAPRRLRDRRDYAVWLADLLDGLKVDRASLIGCSFGGFVALNQASLTPERVGRVVLISPAGVFASQYWKLTYAMRIRTPLRKLMRRIRGRKRAPSMADLGALPRDPKWATQMAVTMAEAAKVSVISPPVFSRAELRAIRAPTLLLIGEQEILYDPQRMLQLATERMPNLLGEIVPGADHIAAMAQPDAVNARILKFLKTPGKAG